MTTTTTEIALHIYEDLEQGTPEWLAARAGIVTASVMHNLVTEKTVRVADNETSRTLTKHLAAERITGYVEPTFTSADMERGNLSEPIARDIYSERYAPASEVGFMLLEQHGYRLGFSPDGVVGDDGLLEIKAPRQKKHLTTILNNDVPLEHMAQIQTGLLVSGREWLDFISYCGGMPLFVKRVVPDEKWFLAIHDAVTAFEDNVTSIIDRYRELTKDAPATERIEFFAGSDITF